MYVCSCVALCLPIQCVALLVVATAQQHNCESHHVRCTRGRAWPSRQRILSTSGCTAWRMFAPHHSSLSRALPHVACDSFSSIFPHTDDHPSTRHTRTDVFVMSWGSTVMRVLQSVQLANLLVLFPHSIPFPSFLPSLRLSIVTPLIPTHSAAELPLAPLAAARTHD